MLGFTGQVESLNKVLGDGCHAALRECLVKWLEFIGWGFGKV